MKKSLKKLSLNKKRILTIGESQKVYGGFANADANVTDCCVETCGGQKTRPGCGTQ